MDRVTIGLIVSICGLTFSITQWLYTWAIIKVKVDLMWKYDFERAMSAGLSKGTVKRNSPVAITDEARDKFESLRPKLQAWFAKNGANKSDEVLLKEIGVEFGREISLSVAVPWKKPLESCLIAAMLLAKEPSKLPTVVALDQRQH